MRNQRDERWITHIADSTDTSATDQKATPNSILDALEDLGFVELS